MRDNVLIRTLTMHAPILFPGQLLHRQALGAMVQGRFAEADRRFERAARRYRRELSVEPLARLRVHQLMSRARASGDPARESEMLLDIVRGLNKLDRLEALSPPFDLIDARAALADWISGAPIGLDHAGAAVRDGSVTELRAA